MPLILPGNVASATASTTYDVANSCRFNDGDSAYMAKTPGGAGSTTKGTFSCWVKLGAITVDSYLWTNFANSTNWSAIGINNVDLLYFYSESGGSEVCNLKTNRVLRDPSAWFHIVVALDSTDGTADDRMKIYINGVQETSFARRANPSSSADLGINEAQPLEIGRYGGGSAYFDGYLAEVCWIDGTAYAASDFGEFDEDSPTIWKPKKVSGLTFGTNGFYLDFEASGNLGNDANGGTDLTETNLAAADQATDTPTNSFCTFMSHTTGSYTTLSEGGLITTGASASDNGNSLASMGMTNGKWYWEFEWDNIVSGYGVTGAIDTTAAKFGIQNINGTGYAVPNIYGITVGGNMSDGGVSSEETGWAADYSAGDVLGMAFDMDNGAWYLHLNGTYYDSGDPTSGGSKTGAVVGWTPNGKTLVPIVTDYNGSITKFNFGGCPAFAISSGNADADGYGNFEYAVPSGYFALCTKNLAEYG